MTTQASVESIISAKLQDAFAPDYLQVTNESYQHNVPPGSESHFKLVVVSSQFVGKRQVGRHQQIYAVLSEELDNGVHALALHTYTPEEWAERKQSSPESPACLGGGK